MTDPLTLTGSEGAPNLAIDVMPDTSGRGDFVLDVSELDGPDLLGYGWTPGPDGWLNIACDGMRVQYHRGATRLQGVLTRSEAGVATIVLRDIERRFDPTINGDAVHKGTPVRVRAWGEAPALKIVELRRNYIHNPRAEGGDYGYLGAPFSSGYVIDGTVLLNGHANIKLTRSGGSVPVIYAQAGVGVHVSGEPVTVSALVVGDPGVIVKLDAISELGDWHYHPGVSATMTGAPVRLEMTLTAPSGSDTSSLLLRVYMESGPDGIARTTDLMAVRGSEAGDYFDGSSPSGELEGDLSHGWTGVPHRSVSVQYQWQLVPTPWESVLFTGKLDSLLAEYDKTEPPTITLTAVDRIGALAAWRYAGRPEPGIGAGDNLLERVQRVVAEMGLPPEVISGESDATTYTATLAPTTLDRGGWEVVASAADAELGRVWVDQNDRIVVRARYSELSGSVWGTLSDWHGEAPIGSHCCYSEPRVVFGPETLINGAIASRRVSDTGGTPVESATVEVVDEYSAARYGWSVPPPYVLELETDAQLEPWARTLVLSQSEPELRVDSVRPAPWGADAETWRVVCLTDLGDRWLFRLHPELGPTVLRAVGILGIEVGITPEGWSILWHTADAPAPGDANPAGWFVLDLSELDGGDLLAPFGGVTPL